MVTAKVSFAGGLLDDRSEASLVLTIVAPGQVTVPRELLPLGYGSDCQGMKGSGQATIGPPVG